MDTARSTHASALLFVSTATLAAQTIAQPDWKKVEDDTLRHYQALIRFDTSATERAEAEYAKRVLDENGVPAKILVKDPERPNVVARLKGPAPEAAACPARSRRHPAGRIGRGRGVELGIGYMIAAHYPEIDAEYCIAEGGDTIREGGEARYATVQVTEKTPRGIELTAHGISGHGSVPLASNAIAHLGSAVGRFAAWQPDIRINETTGTYFQRLASVARPEQAKYYRDVISPDPQVARAATDWLFEHEPHHASMVRTSVSPNIITGGYRSNVIPSDAKARLDVRMVPRTIPRRCSNRSSARSTTRRSTCSSPAGPAARPSRRRERIQNCSKPSKPR